MSPACFVGHVAAEIGLDLVPLQIADLGSPKAVPVTDQNHGCIAVPVAAGFTSHLHQLLNLVAGQIFPGALN